VVAGVLEAHSQHMTLTPLPVRTASATARILAATRALAPELSARARESEQLGTLAPDLVARIRDAGLFRIAQPLGLGGLELEPQTIITVVEEIARADASAGWTVLIGAGGLAFAAWLEPAVARDLLGADADYTCATVFAATGRAVPQKTGGFVVDGLWPFASGCRHAEWFLNGVTVFDGDAPRMLPDRGRDWRLALFPRSEADILDTWDVVGLRGTGSNDVRVSRIRVADEHTISPFFEPARHDGALWRLPFFTLAGVAFAGLPLGVGRRALDEVTELARTRVRAAATEPVAQDPAAQVELARAEGGLQAARAYVFDAVGEMWNAALAGDVPSLDQRARLQLAVQQAMRAGLEAVDTAFNLAGATSVASSHPLQRCFRDLHTANQHAYFSPAALKRYAKTRFGIDQPTFFL
jgi:alkylation response protein AidB-like acyl-CoA dehydrogenase